jgi:uncharacterized membrane protein
MVQRSDRREFFAPERLLAFSDGVFAVVITLLVLDLRLPETGHGDAEMLDALRSMAPKLFIFAFTFIIVGMSWLGHHRKFSYVRQVDGGLLWLNLIYLLTVCLVPFASSVLSEHSGRVGFAVYAAVMALMLLVAAVLSAYSQRQPFLVEAGLPPGVREDLILPPFLNAVIFLIAGGLALSGRTNAAPWALSLIVPVSAFFGARAKRAGRVMG